MTLLNIRIPIRPVNPDTTYNQLKVLAAAGSGQARDELERRRRTREHFSQGPKLFSVRKLKSKDWSMDS